MLAAMNTWSNTWSEHAELRVESERRLRSAAKVFMADRVRKAFNSWSAVSSSPPGMHRALAIFTQRHLALGFSTWAKCGRWACVRRLRSALREWMGSRTRVAWPTWVEMAHTGGFSP